MGPEAPKGKMSAVKAALLFAIAIPRDILVVTFTLFIFIAPSLAATAVDLYLQGQGWSSWVAGIVGFIAGASTVAAEYFLAPITMALWLFGFVMAFVISLLGWIAVNTLLLVYRVSPFSAGLFARNVAGLGILSVSVALIVAHQRRKDRAERKKWEAAEAGKKRAREAQAYMMQLQQARAAEEAQGMQERAAREAANDNGEIPERERLVA